MFWNLVVSLGAWIISCIVWAAIVMIGIGMITITPMVSLKAHLIFEAALLVFWVILPYSVQAEGKKQTSLQSRIFSGYFVVFAGTFFYVYIFTYVEGVHHILNSITLIGVTTLFASYILAVILAWKYKQLSPAKSVLIGFAGPMILVSSVGILKVAATLTINGSLAIVALTLLLFSVGFVTDMSGKYGKQSIDLS